MTNIDPGNVGTNDFSKLRELMADETYTFIMKKNHHHSDRTFERHVVLVSPEVHWNTGNIGRTCLGAGAFLHLIRPLGFSLESRQVRRAGLDYWPQVRLSVWEDFEAFGENMAPQKEEVAVLAKRGEKPFWTMPCPDRLFLIFGSETKGLPEKILSTYEHATYHIPISKEIRCLNLSTAVGITLYESLRLLDPFHAWT